MAGWNETDTEMGNATGNWELETRSLIGSKLQLKMGNVRAAGRAIARSAVGGSVARAGSGRGKETGIKPREETGRKNSTWKGSGTEGRRDFVK